MANSLSVKSRRYWWPGKGHGFIVWSGDSLPTRPVTAMCTPMMTPARLALTLNELGVDVDEATQEEWRKKRLLPALNYRQRPYQPKVRDYFYTEPRVVERAILVRKMINVTHSTDAALLAIGTRPFFIDAGVLLGVWIRQLHQLNEDISKRIAIAQVKAPCNVEPQESEADVLNLITVRASRKHGRRKLVQRFVDVIVRSTWNADFIFGGKEIESTERDMSSYFSWLNVLPGADKILADLKLESGANALHQILSLSALMALAESASPEELNVAREYWLRIDRVLSGIAAVFVPGLVTEHSDPRRDPGIVAGSITIPILLFGVRGGRAQQIETSISCIDEISRRIDIASAIARFARGERNPVAESALVDLFDGLARAWGFNNALEPLLRPKPGDSTGRTN